MIDCHVHISLNGIDFKKSREDLMKDTNEYIRKVLLEYKKRNITVLRDGGDNLGISYIARDIAKEEGIILKTPLYAIYKKGYYGNFLGKGISGIADFKELFKELKDKKIDHLKILISGIVSFDEYKKVGNIGFKYSELDYMVKLAKDNDLHIMAHVNSVEGIDMAINCGVNTIEHGYFITKEQLQIIKEKNIIWVPTLSPLGNILDIKDKKFNKNIYIIEHIYNEHLNMIKEAYDLNVKMAIGSDSGCYGVFHGQGLLDEINHFCKSGIKRDDVIKMNIDNGKIICGL
ncbi:MAG TPA: amidohydrolase family protein [Peptostreptococcaceae bacterium]|nr:amidohydrolase family protein [Peptostreptococcaceae bacterium]